MKYILLWLQGLFEYLLDMIGWIIFSPYYKALYANKIREELLKQRIKENENNKS